MKQERMIYAYDGTYLNQFKMSLNESILHDYIESVLQPYSGDLFGLRSYIDHLRTQKRSSEYLTCLLELKEYSKDLLRSPEQLNALFCSVDMELISTIELHGIEFLKSWNMNIDTISEALVNYHLLCGIYEYPEKKLIK